MKRFLIAMSIALAVILLVGLTTFLSFRPVTTESQAIQTAEYFIDKWYAQDFSEYELMARQEGDCWVVFHQKDNQLGGGIQLYIDADTGRILQSFRAK